MIVTEEVIIMSSVGNNIRMRRNMQGISQSALAEAIGESRQTVYKYESGLVSNIPLAKLELIAHALECSPTDLTGWKRESHPAFKEDPLPYLTEEEAALLESWHKATDKERRSIAFILSEYGMPEPKSTKRSNHKAKGESK